MKYKEFGIYVNNDVVSVLVEVYSDKIIGVDFPISKFKLLSNEYVNLELYNYLDIEEGAIFEANLITHPNILNNYGYLGEIKYRHLKTNIKKKVEEILEDNIWITNKGLKQGEEK